MDIVEKIEALREERGWTKYRLAEESLLSYSTLASVYARKTPPKFDTLQNICNAFGITLAQFFTEDETLEPVDKREKFLLESFRRLSEEKKQAIISLFSD